MSSVIFRRIWSHCHLIKIGWSTNGSLDFKLALFLITALLFRAIPSTRFLDVFKCTNVHIRHKSHLIIMQKTMRVHHCCDSNMYDSKSHRAAFSKQDRCQIPRLNCFVLLTLWSSCLLATQQYMLTTQLKAFPPSGATLVISLWPLREICTKGEERS